MLVKFVSFLWLFGFFFVRRHLDNEKNNYSYESEYNERIRHLCFPQSCNLW